MKKLLAHLNSLSKEGRILFCTSCGISEGYMRKYISAKQSFNPIMCVAIERASLGEISRKDLCPDDWHLIWPELCNSKATEAA